MKSENTNEARYIKFCSKKKSPEPQQLPPTRDALLCHCKLVWYVASIIKKSLECNPDVPSPNGYGWIVDDAGMQVVWMLRKPAPDEILELVSCNCGKSKCSTRACICKSHGLNCTDQCSCGECENGCSVDLEMNDDSDDEDDDGDYDC